MIEDTKAATEAMVKVGRFAFGEAARWFEHAIRLHAEAASEAGQREMGTLQLALARALKTSLPAATRDALLAGIPTDTSVQGGARGPE